MTYANVKPVKVLVTILIVVLCAENGFGARRYLNKRLSPEDARKPFVLLYEHESYRGKEVVQLISKACTNLPEEYYDWASSVDTHRSCASVCVNTNCAGPCHNVYSNQGLSKLRLIGFNDKIKSVKLCF